MPFNFTTLFTTFADQDMPRYAKLCQNMPTYPYFESAIVADKHLKKMCILVRLPRYAKICQETKGKINYDKSFIHLSRQHLS